jgi:hypothetical protein
MNTKGDIKTPKVLIFSLKATYICERQNTEAPHQKKKNRQTKRCLFEQSTIAYNYVRRLKGEQIGRVRFIFC